jgi:hypothetical protein
MESYLRFRVTGVSGFVQSAKLRLWVSSDTADGPAIHTTTSSWSETGITWSNRPARTSGATDDKGALATGTWVEYDVSSFVGGDGSHDFVLATSSADSVGFISREASEVTLRPELVVTYVNQPGYPRPGGATPMHVPLAPAYVACSNPNRTHGAPLARPSCSPPVPASHHVTVGTADANGRPTSSVGSIRFTVIVGDPSTPADEADVQLRVSLGDVRKSGDLSDYTGALQANPTLRITDAYNGPSLTVPATTTDIPFPFTVPCSATAGPPDVGASCAVTTTADAVLPGSVKEGKRAIWRLGQVEVLDGGADGDAATADNTVFARQAIFVP